MISTWFNEELNILEVIYKGKISYEELVTFGVNFRENNKLPRNLKMITDASNAEYAFPVEKVSQIAGNLNDQLKNYNHVKAAFIQAKPTETAISMVLENENKCKKYQHKVFYTRESALDWLLQK